MVNLSRYAGVSHSDRSPTRHQSLTGSTCLGDSVIRVTVITAPSPSRLSTEDVRTLIPTAVLPVLICGRNHCDRFGPIERSKAQYYY